MNILILNGNPDCANAVFDNYVYRYQLTLHKMGHYVKTYMIRNLQMGQDNSTANGSDDLIYIINSLSDTDLIVIASPAVNGRITDISACIQAKISQYYLKKQESEINRANRFTAIDRIPLFGFIIMPEGNYNSHDLMRNKLTQERMATNIHAILGFFITTEFSTDDATCITLKSFNNVMHCENSGYPLVTASLQ